MDRSRAQLLTNNAGYPQIISSPHSSDLISAGLPAERHCSLPPPRGSVSRSPDLLRPSHLVPSITSNIDQKSWRVSLVYSTECHSSIATRTLHKRVLPVFILDTTSSSCPLIPLIICPYALLLACPVRWGLGSQSVISCHVPSTRPVR